MMREATDRVLAALAPERGRFLEFVRGRVGTDAEDVLQVALLRAALRAETLKDAELVVPWFYRILRNAVADHHARRGVMADELNESAAEVPQPFRNTCGCPMTLLSSLRPEYAEILRRVDVDEQSLFESAVALGITTNNAAVRLHRARKALREALLRFCGTNSVRACIDCGCDA
jgi:DNA-directed RNA polymerase specialized sigma24 family protein